MITQEVEITLSELTDHGLEYETFLDLLEDKVSNAIGRELSFFQIVDYEIVAHKPASITIRVEGHEEND